MADPHSMARSFVDKHPADAARVLDGLKPEQVADFFAATSLETLAALLASMAPPQVAAILRCTPASKAADWVVAMSPQAAALALRLLPETVRDTVLIGCPAATVSNIRRHMNYANDSVGAWMESDVIGALETSTVGQLLTNWRNAAKGSPEDVIVAGEHGRYVGLIPTSRLFGANEDDGLSRVVVRTVAPLYDRAPLTSVHGLDDWNHYLALPVVDRHQRPVGQLRWSRVREAMLTLVKGARTVESGSGLIELSSTYYSGMTSLLRALMEPGRAEIVDLKKEKPDDH
jgi:magnesium transporter